MLKLFNTKVYGLEESLVRARYPKMLEVGDMDEMLADYPMDDLMRLGKSLGRAPAGIGHDKFLRFIIVQMDITAPRYWWHEFATYHHKEMMSQSTMHRITSMDLDKMVSEDVSEEHREYLLLLIHKYKFVKAGKVEPREGLSKEEYLEELFCRIKANLPEGLHLTAGISTNYAQLKTMYKQRKNHRLPEWQEFCKWVESLPYAKDLGIV